MTVSPTVANELVLGLRPEGGKQVDHSAPDGDAAEHNSQEREIGLTRANPKTRWLHDRTFLSLVIAIQLGWLAALIYGVIYLLSIL